MKGDIHVVSSVPPDRRGLVVSKLVKYYGKRPVVRGIDVSLARGEVVGLLGPNGAGKTTAFYMIAGLVRPDHGRVFLDGEDISALPVHLRARRGLGYLPQEASVFRGLTVEQNIRAIMEINNENRNRMEARLEELLAEFSIEHLRCSPALALSGGERRRLEIARALASNPSFILLDEPFAGVDPIAVGDIHALVARLKDRNIGVLITDHNVRETLDIIDRAVLVYNGVSIFSGTPSEMTNSPDVRRVYLGDKFQY